MKDEFEMHPVDPKYIKYDDNPDSPDPYDVAMNVSDHVSGNTTSGWY